MPEQEQKTSNGVNKTNIGFVITTVALFLIGSYFILSYFMQIFPFKGTSQPTPSVSQPSNQQTVPQPSVSEPSAQQQQSPQSSASQPPVVEEKVVTYTDDGYSPATLRIKKGDTVTFKNQSSQAVWPASAKHPTHRDYPTTGGCIGSTFDACRGVPPGESWAFTFDIRGSWKYHNHLNPGNTGTVVVE